MEYDRSNTAHKPLDRTQKGLTRCLCGLLDIETVGLQENLFELGLDSVLAAMLINRIREEFNVDLPILTVFQTPTIEAISTAVQELQ